MRSQRAAGSGLSCERHYWKSCRGEREPEETGLILSLHGVRKTLLTVNFSTFQVMADGVKMGFSLAVELVNLSSLPFVYKNYYLETATSGQKFIKPGVVLVWSLKDEN